MTFNEIIRAPGDPSYIKFLPAHAIAPLISSFIGVFLIKYMAYPISDLPKKEEHP